MSFETLVGNRALNQRLQKMARAGSVPPSLLFTGPPGVGKLDAALALAMAENCLTEPGLACGECGACRRIAKEEHPDIRIVRPEGAGRQLKAEAVRQVVREAPSRPFEARRRVSVFVDADRMNPTAANTLLKTLEEPPAWALMILVTENASALLPTILSRCQIYRFAPWHVEEVERVLVERRGMDPERATLLAALSGGSLSRASELEDESLSDIRDEALRLAAAVVDGASDQDIVKWADALSKNEHLLLLLQLLIGVLRDIASDGAGGSISHRDRETEIHRIAGGAPSSTWITAFELTETALIDIRDRYLNKRITLAQLLTRLARLS